MRQMGIGLHSRDTPRSGPSPSEPPHARIRRASSPPPDTPAISSGCERHIVREQQHARCELRHQHLQIRCRTSPVRIEKHHVERANQLSDDGTRLSQHQFHRFEQPARCRFSRAIACFSALRSIVITRPPASATADASQMVLYPFDVPISRMRFAPLLRARMYISRAVSGSRLSIFFANDLSRPRRFRARAAQFPPAISLDASSIPPASILPASLINGAKPGAAAEAPRHPHTAARSHPRSAVRSLAASVSACTSAHLWRRQSLGRAARTASASRTAPEAAVSRSISRESRSRTQASEASPPPAKVPGPLLRASASIAAKFGTTNSTETNFRLSPTTIAFAMNGDVFSRFSIGAGATNLPPAVFSSSFLRSVIDQVAVVIQLADVAGAEPAVRRKNFARLFGLAVIALHHARPFHQYFPVFRDAQLHMRNRPPHRSHFIRPGQIRRHNRRSLRQPISLIHRQIHRPEKFRKLPRERRSARTERANAPADSFANLRVDQSVRDLPPHFTAGGHFLAVRAPRRRFRRHVQRPIENLPLQPGFAMPLLDNVRIHLLEKSRHRGRNRGMHFQQRLGHGLHFLR